MTDLSLNLEQSLHLKQMQRLMMSAKMQQAIHFLQMPAMELAALIEMHLEQNPVVSTQEEDEEEPTELEIDNTEEIDQETPYEKTLSFNDNDFTVMRQLDEDFRDQLNEEGQNYSSQTAEDSQYRSFAEQSILDTPSLFEHLMQQAHETFETEDELSMAEAIVGELTQEGYLHTSLSEIAKRNQFSMANLERVLQCVQTFEPYGVGAMTLQECLLIQLRLLDKGETLAAKIVEKHFDDLLHNRIPLIQKSLECTVEQIEQEVRRNLSHLDLHPGLSYSKQVVQTIVPDVLLQEEGENWAIIINEDYLPPLRLNGRYMRMMTDDSVEESTKEYIRKKITSARWLMRNIEQRNETLTRIVMALTKWQNDFFRNPEGQLIPLTMKVLADELGVHESTIARTVSNKYLDCPRGLLSLRTFFTNAYETLDGTEISSKTVREFLQEMVRKEDKKHPLSDADISAKLQKQGIECARRTIAKYRLELQLGNAQQRRRF